MLLLVMKLSDHFEVASNKYTSRVLMMMLIFFWFRKPHGPIPINSFLTNFI